MGEIVVVPLTNWNGFLEEIQNESPRASVIIASAFLDAQLRQLISNFLIDDPKVVDELLGSEDKIDRPLSTFSARIKAAYCLGLIGKNIYDDLEAIRKIRNKFAHKMHGYTFDEPEIVSWCKSLKLAKMITDASPHFPDDHGSMFIVGVTQLAMQLGLKIIETREKHLAIPGNPSIGQVVRVDRNEKKAV
jgi:DNA-binding MltR family transcriptional regulator